MGRKVDTHVRFPSDVEKDVRRWMESDERTFNKEVIVLLREAIAKRDETLKAPIDR